MNRRRVIFLLTILSGVFWLNAWLDGRVAAEDKQPAPQASSSGAHSDGEAVNEDALPVGTVQISPARQQLIGVRTGIVEKAPQQYVLRALGRVASDETRVYRINAGANGWVRKVFDTGTGSLVKKDQVLATFYSPEFLSAEQSYIYAVNSYNRPRDLSKENWQRVAVPGSTLNQAESNLQQYKDALLNLGMSELQVKEISRTHIYTEDIKISSPVTGFLLSRKVSPGERFVRGTELYSIVDLSHVWILADLFEKEPYSLPPGTRVRVSAPSQKRDFSATVSDALPVFDGVSRTLKVRLEADNPGYYLRPDMFVDIEIPITLPSAITVPAAAILDAGLQKVVYVAQGNGFFQPRQVETGRTIGDRVEITGGLEAGERIALSGTFLIDSESRMELAASGVYANLSKDPVSGLDVSVNKAEKAGRKSLYKGKTFYFVSDETKAQFEHQPGKYIHQE